MRKTWEERCAEYEAKRKAAQAIRRENRKTMRTRAGVFEAHIRNTVKNCGLTDMQIANFAGLDHSTVVRFMGGPHHGIRLETVFALAMVAGYELKLEAVSPKDDPYRSARRFPPPAIDD